MSREVPRTPSVYLSMFTGGSLAAAWISARPSDVAGALSVAISSCACLLFFLLARGFDESIAEYRRRLRAERNPPAQF